MNTKVTSCDIFRFVQTRVNILLAWVKNMSSLSLTPFPTVEVDESGKRSITQWNISIPAKKIKQGTGVYTDIAGHPSLFKHAKAIKNVTIPPELYHYSVKTETDKPTLISAASLDVLKIALWKLLTPTHADKRITVKRTWTIMFRQPKPVEDDTIDFSLFDGDEDY